MAISKTLKINNNNNNKSRNSNDKSTLQNKISKNDFSH